MAGVLSLLVVQGGEEVHRTEVEFDSSDLEQVAARARQLQTDTNNLLTSLISQLGDTASQEEEEVEEESDSEDETDLNKEPEVKVAKLK